MTITQHRVWVYGDGINTDVIFPGKYTYTLKDPAEIAAHALEDLDPSFAQNVQPGDIIVAGRNWGVGSSREQAVTALKYAGVNTIIAESFGGLYFRNCVNQGVHPIVCAGLASGLRIGDVIEIDHERQCIRAAGREYAIPPLPESVRAILDAGGLLPMLQRQMQP
jgi:3-isopropylmalate/(R)-2-methylmalate dehydratase small subunit